MCTNTAFCEDMSSS